MAKFWLTRTLSGCIPADLESQRIIGKFPLGTTFECEASTRQARSGPWHRRYWLLMARLAGNVSEVNIRELGDDGPPVMFPVNDAEGMHMALKFVCGLCEKYTVEAGGQTHIVRIPKSTRFDRMTPDEWTAYWPRLLDGIHQRVLVGVSSRFIEDDLARLAS